MSVISIFILLDLQSTPPIEENSWRHSELLDVTLRPARWDSRRALRHTLLSLAGINNRAQGQLL
ncbi:hypothetical protein DPMN_179965 [Dreissena polymorpha]|uniref:Uncharacterized protein n=1 Tax=Dreissena polymorpha TaxID=45954 RepID=A0A9D4EEZ9_DREPO|nr:hypothetical protein DPMN_179965 [Dreissena polymorpha]